MNKITCNYLDDGGVITLTDGTKIEFVHYQDCCEDVYADLSALEDTGFEEDETINFNNLKIELVKGYGIKLNGYGIPCYNSQNGYYNSNVHIFVNGKEFMNINVDQDLNIFDER